MKRLKRLMRAPVLGVLAASLVLVGLGGGQTASAQTGPVGYTVGGQIDGTPTSCAFFSVDMPTGEATLIGGPSADLLCADGLTFGPDGTLYAYTNTFGMGGLQSAQLVTIDLATGAQTVIGELPPVAIGAGGMTFDAAGDLWLYAVQVNVADPGCEPGLTCLWQVNPADASARFVGTPADDDGVFGLAGSCAGDVLAITGPVNTGPGTGAATELQSVDTATAALDPIVDLPETFIPEGLDYDAGGGLWDIAGPQQAGFLGVQETQLIDPATGGVTHNPITIGGDDFSGFLLGLAIDPIVCPEPPPPAPVVLVPTFTG